MAIPQGLSDNLTKNYPKLINEKVEKVLDNLNKINEGVRKINEIDFCNPLGYILTKALPPGGFLEEKMKKYGEVVTDFINNTENKLDPFKRKGETEEQYKTRLLSYKENIEQIRQSLKKIIPNPDLVNIFPGGAGLVQTINSLNLALTITSDTIDARTDDKQLIINQITLIKSFSDKLKPFMSPINIATLAIGDKAEELNKKLRDFIKPEQFASSVKILIQGVKSIDKAILFIQSKINIVNKLLKLINTLIKVYKYIVKVYKALPIPLAIGGPSPVVSQTMGTTVSKSDRVRELQENIKDYEDIIKMISNFLNGSVISQIQRIRKEIIRLLTGLELLYKNLLACSYTNDPLLEQNLQDAISTLKDNLTILDNLFPTSKTDNILPSLYNGYQINIVKEEVVDEGITLLRRRVIVADQRGITVYEGDPTYATDDQILIKEGQYVINKLGNVGLNGGGNSTSPNQDIINEMNELGLNPNNINVNPNNLD